MAMTEEDAEHLHLLSLFHFIAAGLGALCSLFPLIHLLLGVGMIRGRFLGEDAPRGAEAVGWMFVTLATVAILGGLTISACLAWAGRCLRARRHRVFCLVMAALSCLSVPLGTVLGVFTILVLCRPGVKAAFDARP